MNIVGPLPPSSSLCGHHQGMRYLVSFIDRATRWCEVQPISNIEAETVATAFVEQWVSRFGVPLYVVTDRGRQFESELFNKLAEIVGFHRLRTTAYHPQSNRMIERAHRTIKTALKARGGDWLHHLPIIMLGLRAIPTESGYSPFTAVTGGNVLLPAVDRCKLTDTDFVALLAKSMRELDFQSFSQGHIHGPQQQFEPRGLRQASHVWVRVDRVRKPLEAPYSGPYKVVEWSSKWLEIELPGGRHETVSVDRVKPAILRSPTRKQTAVEKKLKAPEQMDSGQDKQEIRGSTRAGRKVHFPRQLAKFQC